jgi:ribosomal-protein-serine acetyltransferase
MLVLTVDDELELRWPDEAGVEEAYTVTMANYEYLRRWSRWLNESFSLENAREFNERNRREMENGTAIHLRIVLNGKIVGSTGYHNWDKNSRQAEIGCWIAEEHSGRGIATRCIRKLLDYGFGELGLNRVFVKCATENLKSQAIPERLGFTREGVERDGGWLHTKFVDQAVYSLLAREWTGI